MVGKERRAHHCPSKYPQIHLALHRNDQLAGTSVTIAPAQVLLRLGILAVLSSGGLVRHKGRLLFTERGPWTLLSPVRPVCQLWLKTRREWTWVYQRMGNYRSQ